MRLGWRGSRCCTTATAAGKSVGSAPITWERARRPPADDAIATTSKAALVRPSGPVCSFGWIKLGSGAPTVIHPRWSRVHRLREGGLTLTRARHFAAGGGFSWP